METPREVPDELWAVIEPLLPVVVARGPGGRIRFDDRTMLDAILSVRWTGMPWRALTKAGFGPWQTVYDRFAEWKRANLYGPLSRQLPDNCMSRTGRRVAAPESDTGRNSLRSEVL